MSVAVNLSLMFHFVALVLVQSSQYRDPFKQEFATDYEENLTEDEIEYETLSDINELADYDWSPPNGELPKTIKRGPPLSSYFANSQSQMKRKMELEENVGHEDQKNDLEGPLDFSRNKKNQVLCRVQKSIHHHSEPGFEFFPKSFSSYTCHPVNPSLFEGSLMSGHDVCLVRSNKCSTLHLKRFFLKRNQTNMCWSNVVSKEIASGCDCLYHYKYRIHL